MKKFIYLLVVSILFINCFSQNTVVQKARFNRFLRVDTNYYVGNYRISLQLALQEPDVFKLDSDYYKFQKMKLTDYTFITWNLEQTARAYAALGKPDSAIYYLKKVFDIKGCDKQIIYKYDYATLTTASDWKALCDSCIRGYFQEDKMSNPDYFLELMRLSSANWYYRSSLASFFSYLPEEYMDRMDENQRRLDTIVNYKLDSLIAKYGFPNQFNTGYYGAAIAFNIIHHSNLDMKLKYQSAIEKAYNEGLIEKNEYAKYIDRILVYTNCPQKYATQYWLDRNEKRYYFNPVEDTANVSKNRIDMNLSSFEDKIRELKMTPPYFKSQNIYY